MCKPPSNHGLRCIVKGSTEENRLKVKFADFSVVTRDLSLPQPVQSAQDLRLALSDCLKRVRWQDRIRLLGVKASALAQQPTVVAQSPQLEFWDVHDEQSSVK